MVLPSFTVFTATASNWGKVRGEVPNETGVRSVLRSTWEDSKLLLCTLKDKQCCKLQQASFGFFLVLLKNVPKIYEHSVTERLLFCKATNTDLKRHQQSHWEFHPFAVET